MNISDIIDNITNTLDSAKMPANVLPPFLLKCTALNRPGLSAYKIASQIIQNNKALGIPVEDNPDGSANLINQYTYNVVTLWKFYCFNLFINDCLYGGLHYG